ncbi:stalk domain-containing protein [Paenibacillus pini]
MSLLTVLASFAGQATAQSSSAAAVASPVATEAITPTSWCFDPKHQDNQFFMKNGIAYISFKPLSEMFSDLIWTYDSKKGQLTIVGPNRKLSWKVNSKRAVFNGVPRTMSAAPTLKNGTLALPIRDLLQFVGGNIKGYPDGTMNVSYAVLNVVSGNTNTHYWVRRDNGIVYMNSGTDLPHTIGQTNVRANGYYTIHFSNLSNNSAMLTVNHNYGEPSMGNDIYKVFIHNGKVIRESKVSYYGMFPTISTAQVDNMSVMLNGSELQLVNTEGIVKQRYDLKKLGGIDESYTIEYASALDGILLIRPYGTQSLLLVDVKAGTRTVLYQELLSKEAQAPFELRDNDSMSASIADIRFVKREGNVFTFKHTLNTTQEHVNELLTYTLKR